MMNEFEEVAMMNHEATAVATEILFREGMYLDRRRWKEWVGLYAPDAVYWVPAWRNEYDEIDDPDTEISFIYHDSRIGLEERISRIQSRKSVTAMPLPRTTHFVSNVMASPAGAETIEAQSSWMVRVYDPRTAKQHVHFGWYELQMKHKDGQWLIARKKIHLQNDLVPAAMDFYAL